MRIVYILPSLGIGGAEKQTLDLARQMTARGHKVVLLSLLHSGGEEWPVALPVMRLNMTRSAGSFWKGSSFAAQFLTAFTPDLIHSHSFPANIFARMLRFRGFNAPTINTIHNVYEGGWARMLLYRISDRYADRVTAVSTAAAERFLKIGAVSKGKLKVVTNGIDTEEFTPDPAARRRKRKGKDAREGFRWLAVGRLVPAKDYPNLLRAFCVVREQAPATQLSIAGEGNPGDLGIDPGQQGVSWLGLRQDMRELLDSADGFVLSSAWEGLPLAVAEAMAMEKPVVATDVGGVRELVGDAGVIVPAGNSDALAAAMLRVLAAPEPERAAQGLAARARIREHFSLEAKVEQWEQIYRSLMTN